MRTAYTVLHTIDRGYHVDDRNIGIFSSRMRAEHAIAQLKDQPGFIDPRGWFQISERMIDDIPATDPAPRRIELETHSTPGGHTYLLLYRLYFIIERPDDDDVSDLGVYSSRRLTELAKARAMRWQDDLDPQGKFEFDSNWVDCIHWREGFIRMDGHGNIYD